MVASGNTRNWANLLLTVNSLSTPKAREIIKVNNKFWILIERSLNHEN